jgi:hypothetical protein
VSVPRRVSVRRIASRERAALRGVGAAADLVDQHQRARVGASSDLAQVLQVRGEGGEARLDRLLVADVGEDVAEQRQPRARPDRRDHAACASSEIRPIAFSSTVLPPVFGPETAASARPAPSQVERHDRPRRVASSSGCRACTTRTRRRPAGEHPAAPFTRSA